MFKRYKIGIGDLILSANTSEDLRTYCSIIIGTHEESIIRLIQSRASSHMTKSMLTHGIIAESLMCIFKW